MPRGGEGARAASRAQVLFQHTLQYSHTPSPVHTHRPSVPCTPGQCTPLREAHPHPRACLHHSCTPLYYTRPRGTPSLPCSTDPRSALPVPAACSPGPRSPPAASAGDSTGPPPPPGTMERSSRPPTSPSRPESWHREASYGKPRPSRDVTRRGRQWGRARGGAPPRRCVCGKTLPGLAPLFTHRCRGRRTGAAVPLLLAGLLHQVRAAAAAAPQAGQGARPSGLPERRARPSLLRRSRPARRLCCRLCPPPGPEAEPRKAARGAGRAQQPLVGAAAWPRLRLRPHPRGGTGLGAEPTPGPHVA